MTNTRQLAPTVGLAHGGVEFLKGSLLGTEKFIIFRMKKDSVWKDLQQLCSSVQSYKLRSLSSRWLRRRLCATTSRRDQQTTTSRRGSSHGPVIVFSTRRLWSKHQGPPRTYRLETILPCDHASKSPSPASVHLHKQSRASSTQRRF